MVIEDLRSPMTDGTVLVLLDFSKAFDCVDYHLYLHKLVSPFDFHGSARDIFEWSFDCCRCGSSPRALFSSVPQGSVPSPLCFLCLNCLSERIRHSKFHSYADDLQIYLRGIGLIWMA
jgi:hypothetical protein